uniref:EF-hand domain-containing protein n=2 Tax=Parascaris univalens TaxID=6257 RepID=A0A914ZFS5_PARUN
MHRIFLFILSLIAALIDGEQHFEFSSIPSRYNSLGVEAIEKVEIEQKPIQSRGISLEQLLAFTSGLLASDIVEMTFKLADKNQDGLLDNEEAQRASVIGNTLTQYRAQEKLTETEKTDDRLIELNEAKFVAERVDIDGADPETVAAVDKDTLLTPDDPEQVLNTNSKHTPLSAMFGRFDEDSDGRWRQDEINKFTSVMHIDKQRWLTALKASGLDNNLMHEMSITDLQRIMQLYN